MQVLSEARTDRGYRHGFYLGLLVASAVYLLGATLALLAEALL